MAAKFQSVDAQLETIRKGAAEIIPEAELRSKLEASLKSGKPLRVYLGVDPTAPDLHLGHTVVLRKLKHFQDLGHTAVFLIGDFSAMIGDPTGQSETRPPLTRQEVETNSKTYLAQVFKILDREKTEVRYNSEWLDKLSSYDIVRLCGHYRLARMLEREDFRSRLAQNLPIAVHELLYPLLTAVDAVNLKSDVELGATEQKFNLLVHREIQREYGLPGEVALTMPILVGLDGQRKMSKSLGNYVGITEPPDAMFGKLMSISDELMWSYYDLLTDVPSSELRALRSEVERGAKHPMDVKMDLARRIVADFHGGEAAAHAAQHFQKVFRNREAPEEMPQIRLVRRAGSLEHADGVIGTLTPKWSQLLAYLRQSESVAVATRLIEQGGFEVDGATVKDPTARFDATAPGSHDLRLGKKKYVRLIVE